MPEILLRDLDLPADLTDPSVFRAVNRSALELAEREPEVARLAELELQLARAGEEAPVLAQLAVKLAKSRRLVDALEGPVFVSVVFAVFREHRRILPRDLDPHGEDFLRRKMSQLEWLFGGRADFGWELVVVDDGCPEGSGRLAAEMIAAQGWESRGRVLFLEDGIAAGAPATAPLQSAAESQKGGAVIYGMADAAAARRARHVVAFTDADLSTHLGQLGLLLDPILRGGALAAIGSRREPTSVVIKGGSRNDRGKLFIYLWKQLLPQLGGIIDTQCGFKAFDARVLPEMLPRVAERRFAFDIELLLRTELLRPGSVARAAVAWIDSEAASTTTEIQPYLPMLKAVAGMYRRLLPPTPQSDRYAELIEGLDEPAWQRMLEDIPPEIAQADPSELGVSFHFLKKDGAS